jgi:hypothetical protein
MARNPFQVNQDTMNRKTVSRKERQHERDTHNYGLPFRHMYLLGVLVAVIFFVTLFMDSIEIKMSNKLFTPPLDKKPVPVPVPALNNGDGLVDDVTFAPDRKEPVVDTTTTSIVVQPEPKPAAPVEMHVVKPLGTVTVGKPVPEKAGTESVADNKVTVTQPEPEPAVPVPAPEVAVVKASEPAPLPAPVKVKVEPTIPLEPGFKKHPSEFSDTYLLRGQTVDTDKNEATQKAHAQTWGEWTFVDPKADQRPTDDNFYADYSNRDVPRDKFPPNAWQTDKEYLSKFLPQSKALVERAMEAILSEYGHGKLDEPNMTFDERSHMFSFRNYDLPGGEKLPKGFDIGGWTTQRSFDGLARRVLHAVMTEDQFTLVMSGHSSAAGHGNHFQQSYTMQYQKAMEPIFARLGVKCISRNMGMGGMGTIQNALAAGDIYGKDVDILLWDSGMTEKGDLHSDVFARQALISGNRVPALWSGSKTVLTQMHNLVDADVAGVADWGTSLYLLSVCESETFVNLAVP